MDETAPKWKIITNDVLFTIPRSKGRNFRAVLFLHGFTGSHEETWINLKNNSSFPFLIYEDPELSDYDIFSFNYRTNKVSGTSIKKVARQLADEISNRMRQYNHIIILSHSMGGLVGMRYILDRLSAGRDLPIRGLILYGVPINGSYLVSMAQSAGCVLNFTLPKVGMVYNWLLRNEQIAQLAPATAFIQDLNDEWALRVVNGGHSSEDATRRTILPVRVVTAEMDLVVKEVSAKGTYGSIDWHSVDFGHSDLVKPSAHTDIRYIKAKDFLKQSHSLFDPYAFLRLRQISDKVLEARSAPLCRNWEYHVHLNDKTKIEDNDSLLKSGFSPYTVNCCRFNRILKNPVFIGLTWGGVASDRAWELDPIYVHQILTRTILSGERKTLSQKFDQIINMGDKNKSWSIFFKELDVAILKSGKRYSFNPGDIRQEDNMLLREFNLPAELRGEINKEVTYEIKFQSYAPKSNNGFTLIFPWFHLGFKGLFTIHEDCKCFSVNQFLLGGEELLIDEEYFVHKSVLKLGTNDILLPNTRVEVNWEINN